jgi:hypothetical protein
MKKLLLAIIIFCSYNCYAQDEYHNYDELQIKSYGAIYFSESDSITGEIFYNCLKGDRVLFKDLDGKEIKYLAKDVLRFNTHSPFKVFRSLTDNSGIGKDFIDFYEDITPKQGGRLLIIKSFSAKNLSNFAVVNNRVEGSWDIRIYDQSQKKVISDGIKMIAESVKDCDELAEKIRNKEKGYHFTLLTPMLFKWRAYENIVSEYNSCN